LVTRLALKILNFDPRFAVRGGIDQCRVPTDRTSSLGAGKEIFQEGWHRSPASSRGERS